MHGNAGVKDTGVAAIDGLFTRLFISSPGSAEEYALRAGQTCGRIYVQWFAFNV
jgi:hypothetical protein